MKKFSKLTFLVIVLILFAIVLVVSNSFDFLASNNDFEKIDIHEHIKDLNQTERLLPVMEKLNIKKMVLLNSPTLTFGENTTLFKGVDEHADEIFRIKEKYPDKFLVFVTIDPNDTKVLEKFENNIKRGADGIKLYHGLKMGLGPINTSLMYKIYERARENKLPIVIHAEALDPEQRPQLEQMLADFPDLKIKCAHFCGSATNLVLLQILLDKYPNLYVDMSPWQRVGSVSAKREAELFRNLTIKNQDRIMFSSDIVLDGDWLNEQMIEKWYRCNLDLLEKESFECYKSSVNPVHGWNLPNDVLKKIYWDNPEKFLKRELFASNQQK